MGLKADKEQVGTMIFPMAIFWGVLDSVLSPPKGGVSCLQALSSALQDKGLQRPFKLMLDAVGPGPHLGTLAFFSVLDEGRGLCTQVRC